MIYGKYKKTIKIRGRGQCDTCSGGGRGVQNRQKMLRPYMNNPLLLAACYYILLATCCLLFANCQYLWLLAILYRPLATCYFLFVTCYILLAHSTYCLLLYAKCVLLVAWYLQMATCCLRLATSHFLTPVLQVLLECCLYLFNLFEFMKRIIVLVLILLLHSIFHPIILPTRQQQDMTRKYKT